jgi:hypothetical protein
MQSNGELPEAEAAARELGQLSLADAFEFVLLLAKKEPARFERARGAMARPL